MRADRSSRSFIRRPCASAPILSRLGTASVPTLSPSGCCLFDIALARPFTRMHAADDDSCEMDERIIACAGRARTNRLSESDRPERESARCESREPNRAYIPLSCAFHALMIMTRKPGRRTLGARGIPRRWRDLSATAAAMLTCRSHDNAASPRKKVHVATVRLLTAISPSDRFVPGCSLI